MGIFLFIAAAFDISHKRLTQPQAKQRLQWRYGYTRQNGEDADWFASGSGPRWKRHLLPTLTTPDHSTPIETSIRKVYLCFRTVHCETIM